MCIRDRTTGSVASAELSGSPLRVVRRDSLFADPFIRARQTGRNWDVFPDDKTFLMLRQPQKAQTNGFVVINWQQLSVSHRGDAPER